MTNQPNKLRQAAILVATLDEAVAEQLLARLEPEQAAKVRAAASRLADVSPAERDAALQSFTSGTAKPQSTAPIESGVELDGSLVDLLGKYDQRDQLAWRGAGRVDTATKSHSDPFHFDDKSTLGTHEFGEPSFDFLEHIDAHALAPILTTEHPQTVAVVLSCLSTQRAAELLNLLPEQRQADVILRMSGLAAGDPASLRTLATELRTWVETHQRNEQRREQGIATVREILSALSPEKNAAIQQQLMSRDANLAKRLGAADDAENVEKFPVVSSAESSHMAIRPKPVDATASDSTPTMELARDASFASSDDDDDRARVTPIPTEPSPDILFENLHYLDDVTWRRALASVESEVIVLALTGASSGMIDRFASYLPRPHAKRLRQSLRTFGPVRLADVAVARKELARVALALDHKESFHPSAA